MQQEETDRSKHNNVTVSWMLRSAGEVAALALKVAAFFVLLVYLPALVVIALAVIATSRGPAFVNRCYRREDGRLVGLWEFRTECWERWEPTQVGVRLRKSNMHRLPALINVLRGDVRAGERVTDLRS